MKPRNILLSCLFIAIPFIAFAQEQITITTYYPSPYGVYKSLKLYPTDDFTPSGNCTNAGELYYDVSERTIYVCSGTPAVWRVSPGQQAAGAYWSVSPSNANNIYNTNSGSVGIGSSSPGAKLGVNGSLLVRGSNARFNGATNTGVPVVIKGTSAGLDLRINAYGGSPPSYLDIGMKQTGTGVSYCQLSTLYEGSLPFYGPGGTNIAFLPPGGSGLGGNVGIGLYTPAEKLDIDGNIFIGDESSLGSYKTRIRSEANYFAGGATQIASIIEQVSTSSASAGPGIALGFTGNTGAHTSVLVVRGSGNVGIGTREPRYQLELSRDDAFKPTNPSWTNPSDRRLKKDIHPFTDGLEVLRQINPVRYKLNGKANFPEDAEGISVIGQEIEKVAPYTVKRFKAKLEPTDTEETELLSFDSSPLLFVVINAIKEQEEEIAALESELESLKER